MTTFLARTTSDDVLVVVHDGEWFGVESPALFVCITTTTTTVVAVMARRRLGQSKRGEDVQRISSSSSSLLRFPVVVVLPVTCVGRRRDTLSPRRGSSDTRTVVTLSSQSKRGEKRIVVVVVVVWFVVTIDRFLATVTVVRCPRRRPRRVRSTPLRRKALLPTRIRSTLSLLLLLLRIEQRTIAIIIAELSFL